MSQTPDRSRIAEEAAALVAAIERTLAEGEARIRAMGLDPEKVRAYGNTLSAAQQKEAEAAVRADLDAIEQEVAEERARMRAAEPASSGVRSKPRRFI
ncbi:MAG: hypothetical protein JNM08_00205 [Rubrivivax sp.]|nr:hypothetical protein [Rubrivivax sp.]